MPESKPNIKNLKRRATIVIVAVIILGICAYFLWPITQARETDVLVPVIPQNIPDGFTITPPYTKPIEVRIKGPKSVIKKIKQKNLSYQLDLPDAGVGVISTPVNHRLFHFSKDIAVLRTTPSFVTIRIDREIKKELPVDITFSGKPAKGYDVQEIKLKPSSVKVKGPGTVLENITSIPTKPIDLGGTSESFKKEVTLSLEEGITLISPGKMIVADIKIIERTGSRNIPNIPVIGKGSTLKHEIKPSFVNIDIRGPILRINTIDNEISAYIDLNGLTPGTYEREAVISLPVDFTIIGITPEKFQVTINHN